MYAKRKIERDVDIVRVKSPYFLEDIVVLVVLDYLFTVAIGNVYVIRYSCWNKYCIYYRFPPLNIASCVPLFFSLNTHVFMRFFALKQFNSNVALPPT